MVKLELEIHGFNPALNNMFINGKPVKLQNNRNGTHSCIVETDKEITQIEIFKSHQYTSKHWFWWNLLYYFVSIFGLFDIRQDKRCLVVDCRFNVNTIADTKVNLNVLNFENGGKLLDIQGDNIEVINNVQYFDTDAQKRHKKMKKAKTAITIISLIAIIALVCFLAF